MMLGKVSVVVPCFNQGKWLTEALDSVVQSPHPNLLEVIVVDDGSTDSETIDIISRLNNSLVKVVSQANRGLAAARNVGVLKAKGEYILPLDADNRLSSGYFEFGVDLLERAPNAATVYGSAKLFGERSDEWRSRSFSVNQLCYCNYIDACALIRRAALIDVGGYDEGMPYMGWEDWDLWLRLVASGWDFIKIDDFAFDYRVSSNSMISQTKLRSKELVDYIFRKKELRLLAAVRDAEVLNRDLERRLVGFENSFLVRLGRFLRQCMR